jgi:hypothetical protein
MTVSGRDILLRYSKQIYASILLYHIHSVIKYFHREKIYIKFFEKIKIGSWNGVCLYVCVPHKRLNA